MMWLTEREYDSQPAKRYSTIKKWLTYITLFIAGLAMAIDLVTVVYYFIDGQEMTVAFSMKIVAVLVVTLGVFIYYISEIREKLNQRLRRMWLVITTVVVVLSIVWGFAVLGSPRSQRLIKYDTQKVNDLVNISNQVSNQYSTTGILPATLSEMLPNYYVPTDPQTRKPYEYARTGDRTYNICADFNKESQDVVDNGYQYYLKDKGTWVHPEGRYCFAKVVDYPANPGYPRPISTPPQEYI
jgi:hypothetical protein